METRESLPASWAQVVTYQDHGVVLHTEENPGFRIVCAGTIESLLDIDERGHHRRPSGGSFGAQSVEALQVFHEWCDRLVNAFGGTSL